MDKIVFTGATKVCGKCHNEKELIWFSKDKSAKSGYYSTCKECKKQYRENQDVKDKTSRNKKLYYQNNLNELNKKHKEYYINTKESRKIKRKESTNIWLSNNINYRKLYYENNKKKHKEYTNEYNKRNPHMVAWRNLLKNSLKRLEQEKENKTIILLGYSALDLKNHLESLFTDGMSWDNYDEWHIDHIKRVCEFDNDTHPSIVNALSNLQPLWSTTRVINDVIYEGNLNKG
jgi:hypothetical protein